MSRKNRNTAKDRASLTWVLTGDRQDGRHIVLFRGNELRLTEREFLALCELCRARKQTETGYVRIDRLTISVLRRAIDEQLGANGLGKQIIQTGLYREYRLSDDAKHFATRPAFEGLSDKLIDPELKRSLLGGVKDPA